MKTTKGDDSHYIGQVGILIKEDNSNGKRKKRSYIGCTVIYSLFDGDKYLSFPLYSAWREVTETSVPSRDYLAYAGVHHLLLWAIEAGITKEHFAISTDGVKVGVQMGPKKQRIGLGDYTDLAKSCRALAPQFSGLVINLVDAMSLASAQMVIGKDKYRIENTVD